MNDINQPGITNLSSARLFLQQRNYPAARAELKCVLSADSSRQDAIDLLLEVERQEHDQRTASREEAEAGVKPPFTFLLGILLLIIAVVYGSVTLPHLPEVGLNGIITYENKGTMTNVSAKQALLIVAVTGVPGALLFISGVRKFAAALRR